MEDDFTLGELGVTALSAEQVEEQVIQEARGTSQQGIVCSASLPSDMALSTPAGGGCQSKHPLPAAAAVLLCRRCCYCNPCCCSSCGRCYCRFRMLVQALDEAGGSGEAQDAAAPDGAGEARASALRLRTVQHEIAAIEAALGTQDGEGEQGDAKVRLKYWTVGSRHGRGIPNSMDFDPSVGHGKGPGVLAVGLARQSCTAML